MTKSIHQKGCTARKCGGVFECWGCGRIVGWCFGSDDLLGDEHCDDCWHDRYRLLKRVRDGWYTRGMLGGRRPPTWQRKRIVVAEELCDDGFLRFARNGRFALTSRGREAIEL